MTGLKVLISGGGVAGTALAFWLSKLDYCEVTVVEWYPCLRTTGLQIDLRGHGIEVLKRMGLEKAFRERAAPEEGLQFVDSRGKKRAYFGANKSGQGPQGITSDYEIMRGDLCRIIADATDEKVRWLFGTSIERFEDRGGKVEVEFKDGRHEEFDLVVGADGAWSATRRAMLGPDHAKVFHPLAESSAYMTFPQKMQLGERYDGVMYIATKSRAILLRRHNPDEMQLYLLLSRQDERLKRVTRGDVEEEKRAFVEIYEGAGWRSEELLEVMKNSDDFYCERIGIVKMDVWYQGHVALLGDAACAPGGSGMGTSCAIVGAYTLAGEISRHCGHFQSKEREVDVMESKENNREDAVAAALKAYDDTFRPYMNHVHKGLDSTAGSWLMPTSTFGISIFHLIAELFVWLWIDPVAKWFMKETAERWKLPEYEELRASKTEESVEPSKR